VLIQIGKTFAALAACGILLWFAGPYEAAPLTPNLDTSHISGNVDAYFAAREAAYPGITPGTEKRVIWAGARGARTDWVVVYVHGFAATSEELRPVPDLVAQGLSANLVFTRLRGHGREPEAMAEARVQDWVNDVAEALSAARAVGSKIVVIATGTGGTLMAGAAQDPGMMQNVHGLAFVSPNFGINKAAAAVLTWPAARFWVPFFIGSDQEFAPRNSRHGTYWTTRYGSAALFRVAALVKAVAALDHRRATVPAMFIYSEQDQVVRADATLDVLLAWGGAKTMMTPALGEGDDALAHVIAGDILSPGQTEPVASKILNWAKGLD